MATGVVLDSSIINLSADINDCLEESVAFASSRINHDEQKIIHAPKAAETGKQQHKWAIKTFNLLCSVFKLWWKIKSPRWKCSTSSKRGIIAYAKFV